MEFDPFCCPICQDLLYRPVVTPCGHWACHLCLHKTMNPWASSTCFICRKEYNHFGAECGQLSSIVSLHFPLDYLRREQEEPRGEIKDTDLKTKSSPDDLPDTNTDSNKIRDEEGGEATEGAVPPPNILPQEVSEELFSCRSCRELLLDPLVLNCGCLCCYACALDPLTDVQSPRCPICCARSVALPEVCRPLREFIHSAFPALVKTRKEALKKNALSLSSPDEKRAKLGKHSPLKAAGNSDPTLLDPPPNLESSSNHSPLSFLINEPRETECNSVLHPPNDGYVAPGTTVSMPGHTPLAVSLDVDAPAPSQGDSGGAEAEEEESEEGLLAKLEMVHHGVGCDMCGLYPITGKRLKCQVCPDEMGFDLCGSCYDETQTQCAEEVHGRFNQHHTSDHEMLEVGGMPSVSNPDQLEILQRLYFLIDNQISSGI